VLPLEPGWPDSQQLLEVLLHEAVKRRLAWPPRLVDTAADLHAQPTAGGRGTGDKRERPSRPALPTRIAVWATHWSDEVPSLTPGSPPLAYEVTALRFLEGNSNLGDALPLATSTGP